MDTRDLGQTYKVILFCLAIAAIALYFASCSKAKASGAHAEIIPSQDGSTCYGIFDGDGTLKGGNCK